MVLLLVVLYIVTLQKHDGLLNLFLLFYLILNSSIGDSDLVFKFIFYLKSV
jgi:hypothetical protein